MIMTGPRTGSILRALQEPWHTGLVPVAVTTISPGMTSSEQTIWACRGAAVATLVRVMLEVRKRMAAQVVFITLICEPLESECRTVYRRWKRARVITQAK